MKLCLFADRGNCDGPPDHYVATRLDGVELTRDEPVCWGHGHELVDRLDADGVRAFFGPVPS